MRVVIEDDNYGPLAIIYITNIKGTKNFGYAFEEDDVVFAGGTIYNHDGDMYDLIGKVFDGGTMLRKD